MNRRMMDGVAVSFVRGNAARRDAAILSLQPCRTGEGGG